MERYPRSYVVSVAALRRTRANPARATPIATCERGDYRYLVFERFTERARQVVVLAQDEARALKHGYIGTEHLLLGLLREEEGLAARVLESLNVDVAGVRAQVARIVGEGDEIPTGQIPFTPRSKKVLELGLREALQLGHNYIGTEHLLLGLVRENDGVAARILLDFDLEANAIREAIMQELGRPRQHAAEEMRQRRPPPQWEYRVEPSVEAAALAEEWLNARGAEGWELVSLTSSDDKLHVIFKRRR